MTSAGGAAASIRARGGRVLEVAAFALTGIIAVALSGDSRATNLHIGAVWMASAAAALPIVGFLMRIRGPVATDTIAVVAMALAIGGSYTIGGLVLLLPAALLLIAGFLHFATTPQGRQMTHAETGAPRLVGGLLAAALGSFLGLSLSPVAFIGWALSIFAIVSLGRFFANRRGSSGGGFGSWLLAFVIVIGLNALAWTIALSAVAIL